MQKITVCAELSQGLLVQNRSEGQRGNQVRDQKCSQERQLIIRISNRGSRESNKNRLLLFCQLHRYSCKICRGTSQSLWHSAAILWPSGWPLAWDSDQNFSWLSYPLNPALLHYSVSMNSLSSISVPSQNPWSYPQLLSIPLFPHITLTVLLGKYLFNSNFISVPIVCGAFSCHQSVPVLFHMTQDTIVNLL